MSNKPNDVRELQAKAWAPIETAPPSGAILVAYDSGIVELVEDSGEYHWQPYKPDPASDTPRLWMPIPKVPAE